MSITPLSNFEKYTPRRIKELLATNHVKLMAFDLYINDDGTPALPTEQLGEYIGRACLDQSPHMSRIDWIEIVVGITAHFARKENAGSAST